MSGATIPFVVGAGLLVIGGVAKLIEPSRSAHALRGVGLGVLAPWVRVGAAVGLGIGAGALWWGDGVWAVLVAVSYTGFSAFVLVVRRRGGALGSCGCFGQTDTPPTRAHVMVTAMLALAAATVAIDAPAGVRTIVETEPLAGIPALTVAACGGVLAFLVLAHLPRLLELARSER